mgnify:CR=1 FL=1
MEEVERVDEAQGPTPRNSARYQRYLTRKLIELHVRARCEVASRRGGLWSDLFAPLILFGARVLRGLVPRILFPKFYIIFLLPEKMESQKFVFYFLLFHSMRYI